MGRSRKHPYFEWGDIYRVASVAKVVPDDPEEIRDFFSIILLLSLNAERLVISYFGRPSFQKSTDLASREYVKGVLKESILLLSAALKNFPEELLLDFIEDLLDLLLEFTNSGEIRDIVSTIVDTLKVERTQPALQREE